MKITCRKSDLLVGINIAMRAVPTKTTLPILESFLILADEKIRIITNDKDMGIETEIKGEVIDPGKIAIDARIFGEIVRKLPDSEVRIETGVNNRVKVNSEETEFILNGRDPNEFPMLPVTENEKRISMSQLTLKDLIRQTIFSISMSDTNSMMRGELFEVIGNLITVISLDSHRISIRKETLGDYYEPVKVIVPGKTLNEVSRIIDGEIDKTVEIVFDKNFIKFEFDNTVVISRLIEGDFFNVEQMISSDYETEIQVNKSDFLNCIDRAKTLTLEGEKKPIVLDIQGAEMYLDINTSLGSMNAHLPINKNGKDFYIGFNPQYFIDPLKVINDEEISIYFVNANAPCFIRDEEGTYVYIILPVNINR